MTMAAILAATCLCQTSTICLLISFLAFDGFAAYVQFGAWTEIGAGVRSEASSTMLKVPARNPTPRMMSK